MEECTDNIFILEPNKNNFYISHYRYITLTNTIAKICETVIAERLNRLLEDFSLINRFQEGFRTKVSTIDQVMMIVTYKQISLNKNMKAAAIHGPTIRLRHRLARRSNI